MAWNEISKGSGAWVHAYDVPNYGPTNALAVLLGPGEVAVLSPPLVLPEADHAALATLGRVTAIVAPHSGHDLGLSAWKARYPAARTYAPTGALATLTRHGLKFFSPLEGLITPPEVQFRELVGSMNGGTLVRVLRGVRPVLYIDELIGNQAGLPPHWLARFAFWVSGSAPGLRINRVFKTMLSTQPERIARTLLESIEELAEHQPILVPSHGEPLRTPGELARVRELLQSLLTPGEKTDMSGHRVRQVATPG